jgi:hypothetical protein
MTIHVGVALERDRLVARLPSGDAWIRALTRAPDSDSWTDLTEALSELRAAVGKARGDLHIALMPPLANVRCLDLPGVSEAEATQIVSRDPSRFLPMRGSPLVVELEGSGWRRVSPFLLAATPASIIEAIGDAAQRSGWTLSAVVPAQFAWAASASSAGRSAHRKPNDVVVALASHVDMLRVWKGRVVMDRRILRAPEGVTAQELRAWTAEHQVGLHEDAMVIASSDEVAMIAARFASRSRGPLLLPESCRISVRQRDRRGTMIRFATAAVLVIIAAALAPWGLSRERANIAAERVRIRSHVSRALAVRESVAVLNARLATIRSLEDDAPRWSAFVTTLAETLPSDAFLVSLSATGDSLHLEGGATRAAPVFDALARVAAVRSVRPEGPIRQEVSAGGVTSEHFVLAALLTRPLGSNGADDHRMPNGRAPEMSGGRP